MSPELTTRLTLACACLAIAIPGLGPPLWAQERPFDTNACALTLHPEKYNEGLVSVEGWITVGPEEFMLHDASCGDANGKVWLEFGGGVEGAATGSAPHQAIGNPRPFDG